MSNQFFGFIFRSSGKFSLWLYREDIILLERFILKTLMKPKLYPYIDVQDLANYALALQGKDNSVDAYTLRERLDVLDSVYKMLERSFYTLPTNEEIDRAIERLSDLLLLRSENIRQENELYSLGVHIEYWLIAQTGKRLHDLFGCNPSDY